MKRYSCATVLSIFIVTTSVGMAIGATDTTAPKPKSGLKADMTTADPALSGKVVESMNAGGYTYVCIEKKGKKTWVAVPEVKVVVGQEIAFEPGQVMHNFPSKTLNRTFESVVFSSGVAASSSSPAMPAGHGSASGSKTSAVKNVKVEKAAGADAYTVGEVYEKRAKLNKKTIVVRATVVKVSSGIMGSNWLHLQDGTGDAGKATNDLVATTQDSASVGDVVTVKGTVSKDKDFGSGYQYKVMIEKATVRK